MHRPTNIREESDTYVFSYTILHSNSLSVSSRLVCYLPAEQFVPRASPPRGRRTPPVRRPKPRVRDSGQNVGRVRRRRARPCTPALASTGTPSRPAEELRRNPCHPVARPRPRGWADDSTRAPGCSRPGGPEDLHGEDRDPARPGHCEAPPLAGDALRRQENEGRGCSGRLMRRRKSRASHASA